MKEFFLFQDFILNKRISYSDIISTDSFYILYIEGKKFFIQVYFLFVKFYLYVYTYVYILLYILVYAYIIVWNFHLKSYEEYYFRSWGGTRAGRPFALYVAHLSSTTIPSIPVSLMPHPGSKP